VSGWSRPYGGDRLEVLAAGRAAWTETLLHRFTGDDGANPQAGLILDKAGHLYGTTVPNGTSKTSTVFQLTMPASGSGPWTETILGRLPKVFESPYPTLGAGIALKAGHVYGTTLYGGKDGDGTVFELGRQ
jgi:hypothetical protein